MISIVNGSNKKLIQLSGFVTTNDTIYPIPYAFVRIVGTHRGTVANLEGFYSLVAKEGDSIEFSAMGYKSEKFIVPVEVNNQRYSHIQPLLQDTITYPETIILPWQNFDEFKRAILALDLPDDYMDIARRNLEEAMLKQLYSSLRRDGPESQSIQMQQHVHSFRYSGGQTNYHLMGGSGGIPIPSSLLSPQAWAELINAIRTGKFKREE